MKKHLCPICGFDQLTEAPYNQNKEPSYEICPCCGFEFGFDGDDEGVVFKSYRERWIADGAPWFNQNFKPKNWNYKIQLKNLEDNV